MIRLGIKTGIALNVAMLAAFAAAPVFAADSPRLLWGNQGKLGVSTILDENLSQESGSAPEAENLKSAFIILRGNGTPAGYMLPNGNIYPDSITIIREGRRLTRNRDFFLDTVSGAISFADAISTNQTLSATYQYTEGKSVARHMVGLPMLPQFFGGNSVGTGSYLNAYRAADGKNQPFDLLTLGMKMNQNVGSFGWEAMYYISDPRQNASTNLMGKGSYAAQLPSGDSMLVQNFSLDMGDSSRVSVGYQDIGKNFMGFSTLREQGVLNNAQAAQLEKEKGLKRISGALELRPSALMPEGTPWNRFGWQRVYDATGSMEAFQLAYQAPAVGVTAIYRSADDQFKRMGSLSKDELTGLAVQTRQQFDPNATAGQVSDDDRAAVTREAGLSRKVISSHVRLNPNLTSTIAFVSLKDKSGDVSSHTLSLAGSNWQGWVGHQTISDGFRRLNQLAPVEVQRFGNEFGLTRTSAGLSMKLNETTLVTSDYSFVGGDIGSVSRFGLGVSAQNFLIRGNYQSISPGFTRVGDLADPNKKHMAGEVGFTKYDLSFGGQLSKQLKLDTSLSRGNNPSEALFRGSDVMNILYTPADKTKIVLQHNHSSNRSSADILSGAYRDIYQVEHRFANNMFLSFSEDSNLTRAGGGVLAGSVTRARHFETDKSQRGWVSVSERDVEHRTGAFERSRSINAATRLSPSLSFSGAHSQVDRGRDPSEENIRAGFAWAATPSLNMNLDMHHKSTNYAGDGRGYLLKLGGKVAERLGPFTNVNLTGEYGATTLDRGPGTFVRGLNLDTLWGKNVFGLEYHHVQLASGKRTFARGYRFKTDPDPNLPFQLDLYLKDKDGGWGVLYPVRGVNASWKISPTTQFAYIISENKELPDGNIEFILSESSKLTTRIGPGMNLVWDSRHDRNDKAKTDILKRSFGFQRAVNNALSFDVYVGMDSSRTPSGSVDGRSIRLKMDHQVAADRYFIFSGEMTSWDNASPNIPSRTTIDARLDYRMPFDLR